MLTLSSKSCSLFTASGDDLKITSVNKPLFHAKKGTCELKGIKSGIYEWVVTDITTRKRTFKFKASKGVDIQCHSRESGQFQIIIKETNDTTQLLGKLQMTECRKLVDCLNCIKNQSHGGTEWLCAKENLPQTSMNSCSKSPCKNLTKILERNSTKTPLQDQSDKHTKVLTQCDSPVRTPVRTPLGDKPVGHMQRNKPSGDSRRNLPTPDELRIDRETEKAENSDSDTPEITAIGKTC